METYVVWSGLPAYHSTREKEVWSNWLEHSIWVQPVWFHCNSTVCAEPSWWHWSKEGESLQLFRVIRHFRRKCNFNALQNSKILDQIENVCRWQANLESKILNIVRVDKFLERRKKKRDNAGYQDLLFPQCYPLKIIITWNCKINGEKEKLCIMSNLPFSHSIF